MPLILSTKNLNAAQKRHLHLANLSLVEYNAVKIEPTAISFTTKHYKNAIFTSQNAVKLALEKHKLNCDSVFCLGQKTASLLNELGHIPLMVAENARDLASSLINNYTDQKFNFFCSAQRRDELPELFKESEMAMTEHHLYKSVQNIKLFDNEFSAVLCFSPLGVKAYYENHDKQPLAICIGRTTANTASQFTSNVIISSKTSVDSVIFKAIKTLVN